MFVSLQCDKKNNMFHLKIYFIMHLFTVNYISMLRKRTKYFCYACTEDDAISMCMRDRAVLHILFVESYD